MRDLFLRAMSVGVVLAGWSACSPALGQMHKVAKPEQVVRAVGVYEWTGDLTKPTASRLIPVSIFIEGKLEDAGVYVARPVPFALLSGNVYELQDAGIDKGMLDLVYARHLQAVDATGDLAYDDGWFGYGSVKPLTVAKKPAKLKQSKTLPVLTSSTGATTGSNRPQLTNKTPGDSTSAGSGGGDQSKTTASAGAGTSTTSDSSSDPDRPTMKRRSSGTADDTAGTGATGNTTTSSGSTTTSTASTQGAGSSPADDPDRPTMKRRSDSSSDTNSSGTTDSTTTTTASTTGTESAPADDPDRPTMKRRPSDGTDGTNSTGSTTDSTASTETGSTPANDPDRPTLKRHSPEDAKKAKNNDLATVSGTGSLNDDPDRPSLHRGKPTGAMTEAELPKLVGLPPDLHQMVAVSDAANRDPHEFTLAFDDATQRTAVLQKLQGMAQAQLAAYKGSPALAPAPAVKKVTATTTAKSRRAATPAPPPQVVLLDEELKAYTLSYGGAATYVYTAHTAGTGAALRYVTIVAQADGLGELKPAIQNVTDAAHLDRTPRMRFVDVVDAEASNRASLLFELRGQSSRQFGLYRVIAAHSEQIFLTGTTQ
jgi:hypothetical protein